MSAAILIVEDQLLIAWHLRELIEAAGHEVTAIATDTDEAIAAAGRRRPDFALMDIRLRGQSNGLDAARVLYETWGVRSIFLSANLDPQTREQALTLDALGFIGKPFLSTQMAAALERAVEETRGAQGD